MARIIEVWVSTGLVGSRRKTEIEIEDDATEEQIEEHAREAVFGMIDWSWSEKEGR